MEWQPIETAPKDGDLLILACPGGVFIAPWPAAPEPTTAEKRRMIEYANMWPDHKTWTPTHWMPLPAAPD